MGDPTVVRSVLTLDPTHPVIGPDLTDLQRLHARVLSMCDGHPPVPDGRVLWAHPDKGTLVVQSTLPVGAASLPRGTVKKPAVTVKVALPVLGETVDWSMIAAPNRLLTEDGRKRRIAVPDRDRNPWVAGRLGSVLGEVTIETSEPLGTVRGYQRHSGRTITLARHLWTGTGRVVLARLKAVGADA